MIKTPTTYRKRDISPATSRYRSALFPYTDLAKYHELYTDTAHNSTVTDPVSGIPVNYRVCMYLAWTTCLIYDKEEYWSMDVDFYSNDDGSRRYCNSIKKNMLSELAPNTLTRNRAHKIPSVRQKGIQLPTPRQRIWVLMMLESERL